jgi:hypothetical protein
MSLQLMLFQCAVLLGELHHRVPHFSLYRTICSRSIPIYSIDHPLLGLRKMTVNPSIPIHSTKYPLPILSPCRITFDHSVRISSIRCRWPLSSPC